MIEINVKQAELADTLKMLKDTCIEDARVNIVDELAASSNNIRVATTVPRSRILQIVTFLKDKGASNKEDIIEMLTLDESISKTTASVYVSTVSGAGIISRTPAGYVNTQLGEKQFDEKRRE